MKLLKTLTRLRNIDEETTEKEGRALNARKKTPRTTCSGTTIMILIVRYSEKEVLIMRP